MYFSYSIIYQSSFFSARKRHKFFTLVSLLCLQVRSALKIVLQIEELMPSRSNGRSETSEVKVVSKVQRSYRKKSARV